MTSKSTSETIELMLKHRSIRKFIDKNINVVRPIVFVCILVTLVGANVGKVKYFKEYLD